MKKIIAVTVVGLLAFVWFRSEFGRDAEWSALLKTIRAKYPEVQQVSTSDLFERLADSESVSAPVPVLLDTRSKEEYDVSHIRGAIHVSPDATDFPMLDSLSRDTEIVTYCSVGYRSSEIAKRLGEAGFSDVSNLEGSIFKWANEGRPVQINGQDTNAVHPYNAVWGRLLRR